MARKDKRIDQLTPSTIPIVGSDLIAIYNANGTRNDNIDSLYDYISQRITGTTGSIGGSGTTNYVTKWTPDGSTIGNSIIQDNGSEIGLNCTPDIGNGVRIEVPNTEIWSNGLFLYSYDGRTGGDYSLIHSLTRNSNSGNQKEVAILGQTNPSTFPEFS